MSHRVGCELRGNFRVDFCCRSRGWNSTVTRKRSIRSGGSACSSCPCRVHSIVIGRSDRRGWRSIWAQKKPRSGLCPRRISLPSRDRCPSVHIFFSHHFYPSPPTPIFFYRKTSSRLDAMRDTNTRKEILLPFKLRPRSPKFRKKGSGNNKTGETSCTPFHARKKTDLRKKGVNGGPAKGDTFRFKSTRDTFPQYTLPDSLPFVSGESWGSGVTCRVPWHANGWIRGTLP